MANCCPVIACRATAIPEIIGNAGILVEPGDHTAFAAAVKTLWFNRARRSELISEGLKRIEEFSWEQSAQQMLDLLERVRKPSLPTCRGD